MPSETGTRGEPEDLLRLFLELRNDVQARQHICRLPGFSMCVLLHNLLDGIVMLDMARQEKLRMCACQWKEELRVLGNDDVTGSEVRHSLTYDAHVAPPELTELSITAERRNDNPTPRTNMRLDSRDSEGRFGNVDRVSANLSASSVSSLVQRQSVAASMSNQERMPNDITERVLPCPRARVSAPNTVVASLPS
eukprot:6341485-Amphidinium_carterae.2